MDGYDDITGILSLIYVANLRIQTLFARYLYGIEVNSDITEIQSEIQPLSNTINLQISILF